MDGQLIVKLEQVSVIKKNSFEGVVASWGEVYMSLQKLYTDVIKDIRQCKCKVWNVPLMLAKVQDLNFFCILHLLKLFYFYKSIEFFLTFCLLCISVYLS